MMEDRVLNEVRRNRPAVRGSAGDDGLTIVELLIALVVVMIVFAGLAATMVASFSSIRNSEARVRAVALANELVEEMASAPWNQLGMEMATDPDDDPELHEGEFTVLLEDEANPVVPSPTVPETMDRDGHTYEVERWVTWAEEDDQPELKRMIAIVSWEVGGTGATIRSEGLRAPDAQDIFDLEVNVEASSNWADVDDSAMWLHPKGDPDYPHRNTNRIDVTATLGVVESKVELKFRDRNGQVWSLEQADGEAGTSTRTWSISPNTYQFRHGRTAFTVFATGPDGQIASNTATLRFYQQPLVVQTPEVFQDGSPVEDGSIAVDLTGQPCGDVTVEVDVEGMTSGEAMADPEDESRGGLRLRSPGDDDVIDDTLMGLLHEEEFGGRFIGEIEGFDLEEIDGFDLGVTTSYVFDLEVYAERLDDKYGEFYEEDNATVEFDIEVVAECP